MSSRICAIAKDESPYLAEWVFHHLYFGFDKLHIYLNRTTDASAQILDSIIQVFPQVSYESLDWVDNCTPDVAKRMQVIAYGKDLEVAKTDDVDWWLCLDIDEYWVPKDFKTPIGEFVSRFSSIAPICFLWHNVHGESTPFTDVSPDSNYNITPQIKTITPLKVSNIKFVRIHKPCYGNDVKPLNADGGLMIFSKDVDQRADKSMRVSRNAYIVHQIYRSEKEYLAAMIRGRPGISNTIKTNRPGFKLKKDNANQERFNWDKHEYEYYISAKKDFLNKINVDDIILKARENILRASESVSSIVNENIGKEDFEQILNSLKGTHLYRIFKNKSVTSDYNES